MRSPERWGCAICPLLSQSDLSVLDAGELAILDAARQRREYRTGQTVFAMGEPNQGLYFVSGGTVGVRKIDSDGNSVLLYLAYPGDTLGYRSFLAGSEHQSTAEALRPSFICMVDSKTVSEILARNPNFGLQFLKRASTELEKAYDTIVKNATLCNRTRLSHLLLVMLQRHGEPVGNGAWRLRLPMSRSDLASMIGTRYETLSRIIRRLEDDGVAKFSGRYVDIPRLEALLEEIPYFARD